MFVAHLPAGFLLSHLMLRKHSDRTLLALGCIGSILPDLDMIWYYLTPQGSRPHHHEYWTHMPFFWSWLLLLCFPVFPKRLRFGAFLVWANLMLHFVLDSIGGGIAWLWPWQNRLFDPWVRVPTKFDPHQTILYLDGWIWNFIVHWSFGLEILICVAAFVVWFRRSGVSPFSD